MRQPAGRRASLADELILSAEKKILEESSEVSSIWICRLGRFIGKFFRSQFVRNFPITLTEAHSLPSTSFSVAVIFLTSMPEG